MASPVAWRRSRCMAPFTMPHGRGAVAPRFLDSRPSNDKSPHFKEFVMEIVSSLKAIAFVTLAAVLGHSPCATAREATGLRENQISVGFNVSLPLTQTAGQQSLLQAESTRRAFYDLLTRECDVLLASIASTCRLTSANVTVSEQRHGHAHPYVQVNANGQFAIELKAR